MLSEQTTADNIRYIGRYAVAKRVRFLILFEGQSGPSPGDLDFA
jgi:hypothetical protein